ncbi:MAG: ACT domain-containing protein [Erysipelotrichia bacterium]|nr:ACT domain-containing protein [Erysipelotrichia bacterium]NCC54790.1 ACT domain-containing protein [Erysipelotrichia bacterium]
MLDDYLIVNKEVLPEVFEKVILVKQMMEQGDELQVSEAVKKVGISRSTYYKYKDHVFATSQNLTERKAVISFMLSHEKGLLSEVLNNITSCMGNIITINQNIPIHAKASVTISIDVSELTVTIDELIARISTVRGINRVNLISVE